MKKLLLISAIMLLSFVGYGQRYNSVFWVPTDSTVFNKALPSGTVIIDVGNHMAWLTTAQSTSGMTVLTASAIPLMPSAITVDSIFADYGEIDTLYSEYLVADTLYGDYASIDTITCDLLDASNIDVVNLHADSLYVDSTMMHLNVELSDSDSMLCISNDTMVYRMDY
jgi:hypothetical protein